MKKEDHLSSVQNKLTKLPSFENIIIIAILNYSAFYMSRIIFNRCGLGSQYTASEALPYLKLIKKAKLTSSYFCNLNDPCLFKSVGILISQNTVQRTSNKMLNIKQKLHKVTKTIRSTKSITSTLI